MSKKSEVHSIHEIDPTECPFREFRDNELSADFWGLGPTVMRASHHTTRTAKLPPDYVWVDEQAQPLPRSLRRYLHGWVRAEELAVRRWEADISVFEESGDNKMSPMEIQVTHAQVMTRSSFCRRAFSTCYMLEKVDSFTVEHQWENFMFNIGPEGWRARYHIYSPGMKPGGGNQHRPAISKNGCYLVRLYYLGAWRCVWVSDQVPVDANDSPLLPFSPQYSRSSRSKQVSVTLNSNVVYLWPLLICKALLKLAAPDMNCEDFEDCEDELMPEFNLLHSLTGSVSVTHKFTEFLDSVPRTRPTIEAMQWLKNKEIIDFCYLSYISPKELRSLNYTENLWNVLLSEAPVFAWDDDDDTLTSTVKTKSTKKPTTKETTTVKRSSLCSITIKDTKAYAPYVLPGISPGQEMQLVLTMVRDLPLKKPLPEPEVPLWKTYRWVDWARKHGLYDEYECPRTRFLKVSGILKLSYAPHLLDVISNESITPAFREEQGKGVMPKKTTKDTIALTPAISEQVKEDIREWMPYDVIQNFIINYEVLYYPSMYNFISVASNPSIRTKLTAKDIAAPKSSPLYLQVDSPDENIIRISLQTLHPRVLLNAGRPLHEYIEPAHLILEVFNWFEDFQVPVTKGFVETRGYGSIEVKLAPGRHVCRIWVHSHLHWHAMLLSKSSLLLGTRDVVLSAAVKECPWAARFLLNLGSSFSNWIRTNRSSISISGNEKEFYRSYQPDLEWVPEVVGYHKPHLHWMFRQALQSLLKRKLTKVEFKNVCAALRRYLCDPEFGLPPKPPLQSLRHVHADPCDCMSVKDMEEGKEQQFNEQVNLIDPEIMDELLKHPTPPETSKVCEYATGELPCGLLKVERVNVIRRHEAATIIQASWRGTWARNTLRTLVGVTPEIFKCIMENAFGNIEVLSELMNEFFIKYPGARSAYSVASALSGTNSLRQYIGTVSVTPKCKWLPYFQAVFYCHAAVKVHLDVKSPYHSMVSVYDNDTGVQKPHAFSAHVTYDFEPNDRGYTVLGHAKLLQPHHAHADVNWQLTVLCSLADAFHICDNDIHQCKELPLSSTSKFHVDEMFVPNRRNILGGIQILVNKQATISFRAAATTEMVAVLRTSNDGQAVEVGRCSGEGELYWPYIRLEPTSIAKPSASHINLPTVTKQKQSGLKAKSATKVKDGRQGLKEPKLYYIDVIAPDGWPLTVAQWIKVDRYRNSLERYKTDQDASQKKLVKEKGGLSKDKEKSASVPHYVPLPGDAYIELECSLGPDYSARRDDERDLQFMAERRTWSAGEPGRGVKCAKVRKEFRDEFLVESPATPAGSTDTIYKESVGVETVGEDTETQTLQQGPSPASELVTDVTEISATSEEVLFLNMPDELKDKFIPLYFVSLCTKDLSKEGSIIMTPEMIEAAEVKRREEIDEALERTRELQEYNDHYVMERHKIRCQMLEKYYTHACWSPELTKAFEERDDAIAQESLNRTLSATKKKQEIKKK